MLIVCVDQEVRVVGNGADDEHQWHGNASDWLSFLKKKKRAKSESESCLKAC